MNEIVEIPVDQIDEPTWNSRVAQDKDKLAALAATLKSEGQQSPVQVQAQPNGRYLLHFGSRRLAAFKLLGAPAIRAVVVPPRDEVDRVVANIVENVARENLTTYELARACSTLRTVGKLSLKETSEKLGISAQRISNLDKLYEFLPEPIKAAWMKEEPAATTTYLRDLIGETKKIPAEGPKRIKWEEDIIAEYGERSKLLSSIEGDDDVTATPAKKPGSSSAAETVYKVTATRYGDLLTALKKSGSAQIAALACKYLVGDIDKIKGIIEPEKKSKKDPKPETKKDKE